MSEDIEDVDGDNIMSGGTMGNGGGNFDVGSDPIVVDPEDVEGVPPNIGKQLPDNSSKRKRTNAFTVVGLLVGIVVLALILTLVVFEPHEKSASNAAEAGEGDGDDADVLDDGSEVMIPNDNDGVIMDGLGPIILDEDDTDIPIWPNDYSDIDVDPNLTYGQLENGFRYMIYPHNDPEYEISMQLHVNVGSLHEDNDQLG